MTSTSFFGYGSLVNLKTHDYTDVRKVAITGWRRVWRSTTHREFAILSATPDPETTLDGIIASVPKGDWAALDQREFAYRRNSLTNGTAIYEIVDEIISPASGPYPILRSYLDVVIQGYLREFGPDGVARFFQTTDQWGPIHDDRAAPLYPRHQPISAEETAIIDHHLTTMVK